MKKIFIIPVVFGIILIIISSFFFINYFFKVKTIEVKKNFDISDDKLFKYLNMMPHGLIFSYDSKKLEEKLSKIYFISYYKIIKKYPDKLIIEVRIRNPLAKLSGTDGNVFFIDEKGVIFQKYNTDFDEPLIIYENAKVRAGMRANDNLQNIIGILDNLKKESLTIYNGISQIEIYENNNRYCDYIVNYRTNNNRFYLKNDINVDLLKKGFICALYLGEEGIEGRNITYTGAGFAF
jgi:hypothetical protein